MQRVVVGKNVTKYYKRGEVVTSGTSVFNQPRRLQHSVTMKALVTLALLAALLIGEMTVSAD